MVGLRLLREMELEARALRTATVINMRSRLELCLRKSLERIGDAGGLSIEENCDGK
jgi:hypothetical protein